MLTLLLAAGLVAGLVLASAETFAAGPIAPGTISATSVGSAEAMVPDWLNSYRNS
jgi:hypothetical protein